MSRLKTIVEIEKILRDHVTNGEVDADGDPRNYGHPLHDSKARYAWLVAADALKPHPIPAAMPTRERIKELEVVWWPLTMGKTNRSEDWTETLLAVLTAEEAVWGLRFESYLDVSGWDRSDSGDVEYSLNAGNSDKHDEDPVVSLVIKRDISSWEWFVHSDSSWGEKIAQGTGNLAIEAIVAGLWAFRTACDARGVEL